MAGTDGILLLLFADIKFSLPFNVLVSLLLCVSFFFFNSKTFKKPFLCTPYNFPEFPSVHSHLSSV